MTSLTNQAMDPARPRLVTRLSSGLAIEAFLAVTIASYFLAFLFRCQGTIPSEVMAWFWTTLPVVLGLKTVVLLSVFNKAEAAAKIGFKANHMIFVAASLSAVGIYVLNLSLFEAYLYPIPRSVIAIDWALCLVFWFRLQAIGTRFAEGTAVSTKERNAKRSRQNPIPTISMGSGGPKVKC